MGLTEFFQFLFFELLKILFGIDLSGLGDLSSIFGL